MRVLVTGATGNIGRMVVDHLVVAGGCTVRALTVDPTRAALPSGVEVTCGYLRKPDTLPEALDGVDAMYLAPAPETVGEVMSMAKAAGVDHVVDLSGPPGNWWSSVAANVEAAAPTWTHLWPWDFMENTLSWAPQIRASSQVREPYPNATGVPIAMDDIAAIAARILLDPIGHDRQSYTIIGPQALTRMDLVRHLSDALGRTIEFVQVSRDEAVAARDPDMGQSACWYVDTILSAAARNPAALAGLVTAAPTAELLGRPATTFAQWAQANDDRFR